jgi:hypothetical protein
MEQGHWNIAPSSRNGGGQFNEMPATHSRGLPDPGAFVGTNPGRLATELFPSGA